MSERTQRGRGGAGRRSTPKPGRPPKPERHRRHERKRDLTIDGLARESGMTVRTIRSHTSRGLLPAPEVRGRTGYYGREHLARLSLIQQLQGNGYSLNGIKHLLSRTDGHAEEILDFARALLAPFERERPEIAGAEELARRYGGEDQGLLRRAIALGLIVPLGEGQFEIPSPTLLGAGDAVAAAGVPPAAALDVMEQIGGHAESVAELFVELFLEHVWRPYEEAGEPEGQSRDVRAALDSLRPLATEVLVALFHQRMTRAVEDAFGRVLEESADEE